MEIQQVTKAAASIINKIKFAPLPVKLALGGGIIGLGLVHHYMGDRFEKQNKEVADLKAENAKLMQQNDSLKTVTDSLRNVQQTTPDVGKEIKSYEYIPPKGDGIVADTIAEFRDGTPATISYSNNGIVFELEHRTSDGFYAGKAQVKQRGTTRIERHFNKAGNYSHTIENLKDGTSIHTYDGQSNYEYEYPESKSEYVCRDTYKDDNCISETFEYYIEPQQKRTEEVSEYDSKAGDWILRKLKNYDDSGLLQYTVTPKYNEDGDLIKRDTVWVNK